jgi:hypothetical protein
LLELSDTASGQTVSGLDAWAEIVALQDKSLVFRYLVPEQLTNSSNQLIDLSHEIVGIRGIFAPDPNNSYTYTRNILNSSANPWNLVLTGKNNAQYQRHLLQQFSCYNHRCRSYQYSNQQVTDYRSVRQPGSSDAAFNQSGAPR